MRLLTQILAASVVLAATPATATAQDWFVSPFAALNTGGDTTTSTPAVGVSGGWLGEGWFGAEGDFGWAPTFFEQDGFLVDREVRTLMGNAMFALPIAGSVRPVVSGGVGMISTRLTEAGEFFAVDADQFGWNVGAGAFVMGDHLGGRVDFRYFRTTGDDQPGSQAFGLDFSKFAFWRASVGLAVRF